MSYEIWANHAHIFQEKLRPEGTVDALRAYMDRAGISHAVAFAPLPGRQSDGLDDRNGWLAGQIAPFPELTGFGTVDFDSPDITSEVRHIAELGLKGIKVHPQAQDIRVNCPRAFKAYAAAEQLGLIISFHTGVHYAPLCDSALSLFDDISQNFPALRFTLEHVGGYCFFREAVAVMANRRRAIEEPKIFAGLTSIYDRGKWYLSDAQLEDLIFMTGEKASMFGLDFPYNNSDAAVRAIERIRSLNISDQAKEGILGGNLRRELGYINA